MLISNLEHLSEYPNFKRFEPTINFDANQIQKLEQERTLSSGIPNTFFICLGSATAWRTGEHLQHINVGATTPMWSSGFPEFGEMCRSARDIRFGPDKSLQITKAIDALMAIEADHFLPAKAEMERKAHGKNVSKKALVTAKIEARKHAIDRMQAGHPDFINHLQEFGQAYNGRTLQMKLACYCCQGIFGYSNVLKEESEMETRDNVSQFGRSDKVHDHQCAEAAQACNAKLRPFQAQPRSSTTTAFHTRNETSARDWMYGSSSCEDKKLTM